MHEPIPTWTVPRLRAARWFHLSLFLILCGSMASRAADSSTAQLTHPRGWIETRILPLDPAPSSSLYHLSWPSSPILRAGVEDGDAPPGPFTRLGRDAARAGWIALTDMGHLYSAPARMTWSDGAWVAGALGLGYALYAADQQIYDAVQDIKDDDWYRPVRATGEFFEPMGTRAFTESWYIGGLVAGYITGYAPLRDTAADMLEGIYLALPVMTATKFGTGRLRPYQSHRTDWGHSDGASFISGHTTNMFLLAGVIANHGDHVAWDITGYTIASAVALERITSTDHWPSDVYAGALWGWFVTRQMFARKATRSVEVLPMLTATGDGVGLRVAWQMPVGR